MTDATNGAGTAYPSGVPEFTTVFSIPVVHVAQSLVFSGMLIIVFLSIVFLTVFFSCCCTYTFS
jgi:hypothetical protein